MKILIIEDHIDVLDCLRSYFQEHGHQVVTATTANEGILLLQHSTPDLALIDLRLPKGNGRMVVQEIARRRPECHTTMVVITADDNLELRRELRSYGVVEYLFKPITIKDLDNLVEALTPMFPPEPLEEHADLNESSEENPAPTD